MDIKNLKVRALREDFQNKKYNLFSLEAVTKKILETCCVIEDEGMVPITDIVNEFGLTVFEDELKPDAVSQLFVHGDTKEIYGVDEVVLLEENLSFYDKRVYLAQQFGYYLFCVLGSPDYQDTSVKLFDICFAGDLVPWSWRFAESLLMPEESFLKYYEDATSLFKEQPQLIDSYLSSTFEVPVCKVQTRKSQVLSSHKKVCG